MKDLTCKLLIIGAGPGGYVCAIRAGQLGLDTILVEESKVGGTCLNIGCIPSKALIHTANEYFMIKEAIKTNRMGVTTSGAKIDMNKAVGWKNEIVSKLTSGVSGLIKKAGVRPITGKAEIIDGKTVVVDGIDGQTRIRAEHLVIATGSTPKELLNLPFSGPVLNSTDALDLIVVPPKLAVVGGGYIGLEIGTAFSKLGSRVTIIEASDRLLSQYDDNLTKPVALRLKSIGIDVKLNTTVTGLDKGSGELQVTCNGVDEKMYVDKVLVTIGRVPSISGFGLEKLSLSKNSQYVQVGRFCETSMARVYAIGDITGEPMLAHRAMAQGKIVAEHIAGHLVEWDKRAIPAVCFTDPEIITVGLSPSEAIEFNLEYKVAQFPFQANGRCLTLDRADGFVRIVFDPASELVLGIQAVGVGCSELAGEFGLAIEMAATLRDLADTIHAHPTLGETVQEAALIGLGNAIHI